MASGAKAWSYVCYPGRQLEGFLHAQPTFCVCVGWEACNEGAYLLVDLAGVVQEGAGAQVGHADGALAGGKGKRVAVPRVEVSHRDHLRINNTCSVRVLLARYPVGFTTDHTLHQNCSCPE